MPLTGNTLIVLLGPTAIGKTGLATALAQAISGEIIGADSRQIYQQMDIGTAKPDMYQQVAVRHHLIDVVRPDTNLSLAQYQKLAYVAIDDVLERGHVPILVGGTGQYITSVVEGWSIPEIPPNEPLRRELEVFAEQNGAQALHNRLEQVDAVSAATIDSRNIRRVIRALEVCLESGKPMSELQRKQPPPYQINQHGLTMERGDLYTQADSRVDQMIKQGFLEEVQELLNQGYSRILPSMSGLGYRELAAHISGEITLTEAVNLTKNNTHDFIRRQYTWFRGHDSGIQWQNISTLDINAWINSFLVHE